MKTATSLQTEIASKRITVSTLIKQLHQAQVELEELESQLQSLQLLEEEEEEEASAQSAKQVSEGDRVVILCPHKQRQGITGHVARLTKSGATADFISDSNEKFPVRVYNLFKLKKKSNKTRK